MNGFDLLKRELQQRVQISCILAHIDELLSSHGPETFQKLFCAHILHEAQYIDKRLITKLSPFFFAKFDRIYGGAKYALDDAFLDFLNTGGDADSHDGKCDRFYCFDGKCIRITASESLISEGTTGYSLWEASVALLAMLSQPSGGEYLKQCFMGKRVLELGSGTGLGGLAVAALTAPTKVVLTDIAKVHDSFTRPNWKSNRSLLSAMESQIIYWDELTETPEKFAHDYNVVLGCDLVYDPEVCAILLSALKALLSSQNSQISTIVLLCTLRNPQTFSDFVSDLKAVQGLNLTVSSIDYNSETNPIVLRNLESFRLITINR